MKRLRRYFATGLLVLGPAAVTFYVLWIIFNKVDGILGGLLTRVSPLKVRGLGFLAVILLVFLVGMLASNYAGRRMVRLAEDLLSRVPVVRALYGTTKEFGEVFLSDKATTFRRAVLVEFPRPGMYALAFVTAEGAQCLRPEARTTTVHVFVPTTPNPTTGFFLVVPKEQVMPLELPMEEAIKLVITGGVVLPGAASARPVTLTGAESPVGDARKRPATEIPGQA